MATVTTNIKGADLRSACPAYKGDPGFGGPQIVEVTYDGPTICNAANGYGATSDIFEVMTIGANTQVVYVHLLLATGATTPDVVEGGTSTINIGDTGSATSFATGSNTNGALNSLVYTTGTKFYTAADKLRIAVASGTLKLARFRIRMCVINYGT
jgi:hypothetical protein